MNVREKNLRDTLSIGAAYEAPVGEFETRIAELFAEVFAFDRIGVNDDFFDLGGDSIMGESLATHISQSLGRSFQTSFLAKHSTPRKVAALLLKKEATSVVGSARPPIFIVPGRMGYMMPRPEFMAGLAPGQEVRMFELPGIHGERPPHTRIEAIAADYVDELQKEYPSGPVLLAGYCRGSLITLEMAAQLELLGRPVLQMVLFDPQTDPENLTRYFRFLQRPELEKMDRGTRSWLTRRWYRRQLKHLRYFLAAGRWTDGAQAEDFSDERIRRMREREYRKLLSGNRYKSYYLKPIHLNFSQDAQAKLLAAYHHYMPRPFPGPVTVFASEETMKRFEKRTFLWSHLLPDRALRPLGETHEEVIRAQAATGAKLMQEVFDAALSRHAYRVDAEKSAHRGR